MFEGFGHMGFGWIFWFILIIAGTWLVINATKRNNVNINSSESALDILKKRYARGEITSEQFEEMKQKLKQ